MIADHLPQKQVVGRVEPRDGRANYNLPKENPVTDLTPGFTNPIVTQETSPTTVAAKNCSIKEIRPPVSYTSPLKFKQMKEYGDYPDSNGTCMLGSNNPKCYEEDHLISLENGGNPTDPCNLWPEPYDTKVNGEIVGAHQEIPQSAV